MELYFQGIIKDYKALIVDFLEAILKYTKQEYNRHHAF